MLGFALACALFIPSSEAVAQSLIRLTNEWRYNQSGTNLGTAWKESAYDDSAWLAGRGVLAYETNNAVVQSLTNTVLRLTNAARASVITYYFRTHFNFTNSTVGVFLAASNLVDDGAVVYLNGFEIYRVNMTFGVVNASTLAIDALEGVFTNVVFLAPSLQPGDNVLAVEVHQSATNSTDVVFGMTLGQVATPVLTSSPTNQVAPPTYPVTFSVEAWSLAPMTYQWLKHGTNIVGATNPLYTISAVSSNDYDYYAVTVRNVSGFIRSTNFTLSYRDPNFRNPENFELGWGDWRTSSSIWQIGRPTSGPGGAHQGANVAATVLDGDYPDNAEAWLYSPAFVVSNSWVNPRLRFWSWHNFNCDDYGSVRITTNGWATWQALEDYWNTSSGVWSYQWLNLSSFAGKTVQIGFYFYSHDNPGCGWQVWDVAPGWYIDEVSIVTGPIGTLAPNVPESFEGGLGDWSAWTGTWEIGRPTSGPGSAHSGVNCAATVLGGNYYDNTDGWLLSPVFVVSNSWVSPRLRFWNWYDFNCDDYGSVRITTNGGATWQTLEDYWNTSSGVWSYQALDLSGFAGKAVQIGFYFYSHDNPGCGWQVWDVAPGWYIDEVSIVTGPIRTLAPNVPESFERGWSNWYAWGGTWEIGRPASGPGAAHSGVNCAATVLGGNYYDNTDGWLLSPMLVVSNSWVNPRLRFWSWHNFNCDDYGSVRISVNGGAWQALEDYWNTSSGVWSYQSLDLSSFSGKTVQIGFYFYSHDNPGCGWQVWDVAPGWYIDEVSIVTGPIRTLAPNVPESFEGGWGDWYAWRGTWEIGRPISGPGSAPSGVNCAATVLGGDYYDNTEGSLNSPMFVVPASDQHPKLTFDHWFSFNCDDYGRVYIWSNNQWILLAEYSGSSGGWIQPQPPIDLSPYAGQTVALSFNFTSHDNPGCGWQVWDVAPGWYIDDVTLVADLAVQLVSSITNTQETICVPLRASACAGLNGLTFDFWNPACTATGLVFTFDPRFNQITTNRLRDDLWHFVLRTDPTNAFWGDAELGTVCFPARFTNSAFVPMLLRNIVAMNLDGSTPRPIARDAQVTLLGGWPLIQACRAPAGQRKLLLYDEPGRTNEVIWTRNLTKPVSWTVFRRVVMTNAVEEVSMTSGAPPLFFQVRRVTN